MSQKGFAPVAIFILGVLLVSGLIVGGSFYVKYQKPELLERTKQPTVTTQENQPKVTPVTSGITNQSDLKSAGYKVTYKNISFMLPVGNIDSQQEQDNRLTIKFSQDKSVVILFMPPDLLLKVSDLSLDNASFTNKYKLTAQPEIALQKQAIEKFSGNHDRSIVEDITTQDKLKLVKKLFLNFEGYTYSIVMQGNITIILGKSTSHVSIISLEDKAGNYYQIFVKDKDAIEYIISTLQVN